MKKLFTFVCLWAVSCVAFSAMAQSELNGNIYTIHCRTNNNNVVGYMQDNKSSDNRIEIYDLNDASYWRFIATENENCYYIKNVSTGRYIQGYTASDQIVTVGSLPVEYYVKESSTWSGSYGLACTSLSPHNFSTGTIGLNLHGESNETDCYAQSYAAVDGTNGRSFWILEGGTPYIGEAPQEHDGIFLYNVGTDKWIQDNDFDTSNWTSYAHLGTRGRDMRLISEGGGYRINPKMGGDHDLREDLWMDTSENNYLTDWTFTLVDGTTDQYTITYGNYKLGANSSGVLVNNSDSNNPVVYDRWQLVPRDNRIAYARDMATSDSPVDMTWIILGGTFPVNDEHTGTSEEYNTWKGNFNSVGWTSNWGDSNAEGLYMCNRVFELGNNPNADIYQEIDDLPNGSYVANADIIYSSGTEQLINSTRYDAYINGTEPTCGYFYANDESVSVTNVYDLVTDSYNVKNPLDLGNGKWSAYQTAHFAAYIFEGDAKTDDINLNITDGYLKVGAKNVNGPDECWLCIDNFRLYYYGNDLDISAYTDALKEILEQAEACKGKSTTDALATLLETSIAEGESMLESTDIDAISEITATLHSTVDAINGSVDNVDALRFAVEYESTQNSTDEMMVNTMEQVNDVLANSTSTDEISTTNTLYQMTRRIVHGGHHHITLESTAPSNGLEAYIYNVGAGLFLCGGNDWGTHASLGYTARIAVFSSNTSGNDRYDIRTNLPNGTRGVNDWLGHNGYVDCGDHTANSSDWAWQFEAVGDGSYRIINCGNSGDNIYLGLTETSNLQVDTDKSGADNPYNHWKLFTKDQLDKLLESASYDNPVDASYYIHQPTFSNRDFDVDVQSQASSELAGMAWTRNYGAIYNWGSEYYGNGDYVFEIWNSGQGEPENTIRYIDQEITELKPGVYEVSLTGYYRDGQFSHAAEVAGNSESWAYLFANDDAKFLPAITDCAGLLPGVGRTADNGLTFPDACDQAAFYFQMGLYTTTIQTTVGSDGKLLFGVSKERTDAVDGDDWVVVDNFRLTYLGPNGEFTITDAGYATYYTEDEYTMPEGVVGTTITGIEDERADDGGYILDAAWSYEAGSTVPSKTALVLQGEAGTYEYTITNTNAAAPTDNMLNGSTVDKTLTYGPDSGTEYYFYELTYGTEELSDVIGFFWANEDGSAFESEAHKAWLSVPQAMATSIKHFSLSKKDEETTGITNVEATSEDAPIYNLQGVRLNDMSRKGVYIVGGKKVIVK